MVNLQSSGQRNTYGPGKKKHPYLWMIQNQASQGQATSDITNKMQTDLAEKNRQEDKSMWQKDYNLNLQTQKQQEEAAQTATSLGFTTLGTNIWDKFGGKGSFGTGGGGLGGAAGGAALGYGLGGLFGDKSDKNKKYGAVLGGLAGWFF